MPRDLTTLTALLAEHSQLAARPTARRGTAWFNVKNLGTDTATIMIMDEIGAYGVSAQAFVMELNAISAPNIHVRINSPGGSIFDGVAIHTALATHPANVTTFIDGVAASAASFIAMAGDMVVMARNAQLMLHDGEGITAGTAADHRSTADLLDRLSDNIADIYSQRAGGTPAEWRDRMRAGSMNSGTWYNGMEALAAGLVDEVPDGDEPAEDKAPAEKAPPSNSLPIVPTEDSPEAYNPPLTASFDTQAFALALMASRL